MNPKAWVEAIVELIWRIGLRLALWVGLGYFLFRVRSVITAIILAAVVTYAILPVVDFLCSYHVRGMSRKFQRLTATILVFMVLAALLTVVVAAFFTPFQMEFNGLVERLTDAIVIVKAKTLSWYGALPPDAQDFLQAQKVETLVDKLGQWGKGAFNATLAFFSHLVGVILIPVLAFYFTLDSKSLKHEFVALIPRRRAREALAILHELNIIMRSYVIGQIILCVIAGLVVAIILKIVDMDYILILGVFAGITRAIPVVGPILSGLAIVLLGIAKAPMLGVYLLILFVILQFAESKFIMPKLIGDRMQLHPALVIIVLLIGAEFFGLLGMFMAAPVAAILRVIIRYYLIKPRELRVWGLTHVPHEAVQPEVAQSDIEAAPAAD